MLQDARGLAPLHIYMQGDSAFRQQKNFLCNLLQPGFTGGVWALDQYARIMEPISGCYSPELGVRVTHVDNSCCNTARLAHLARTDADPYGSPNPPAWRPAGVGSSSSSGNGSSSSTQQVPEHRDTTLVVFMNCGLHLMHLGEARPFECLPEQYGYMRVLRDFSDTAARLYPRSPQVFMTSNDICQSSFRGTYHDALANMTRDPESLVRQCVALSNNVTVAGRKLAGNIAAITAACRNGLFIGESARLLRERMLMAVALLRRRHHGRAFVSSSAAAAAATAGGGGRRLAHNGGGIDGVAPGEAGVGSDTAADGADEDDSGAGGAHAHGPQLRQLLAAQHGAAAAAAAAGKTAATTAAAAAYDSVRHPQQQHEMEVEALLAEGAGGSPVPPTTVDVVDGYAITAGQCWASQINDGRHYPYLVPMQVLELISVLHRRLLSSPQQQHRAATMHTH
ncbi:hypothetical protein HXX76_013189 [Chlamydomonas incerta]|uniref:Uncharacterized protein n=1 Tax=Chlamydomonas incerta TaxID=51695 RepID=A0A835VUD8_CHLIN|nr:hypothetical protein HXX76_013189 [Chlamydomonas incerta]|eukprot:KAG2426208.1 hypothetical protein HXX76_013189 [Chlamydomonas incerta]